MAVDLDSAEEEDVETEDFVQILPSASTPPTAENTEVDSSISTSTSSSDGGDRLEESAEIQPLFHSLRTRRTQQQPQQPMQPMAQENADSLFFASILREGHSESIRETLRMVPQHRKEELLLFVARQCAMFEHWHIVRELDDKTIEYATCVALGIDDARAIAVLRQTPKPWTMTSTMMAYCILYKDKAA